MKNKINILTVFLTAAFFMGTLFPYAYSGVDNGLEQMKVMVDVMSKVQDNYVEETSNKDLIKGALGGMVASLDEFSEFIPAENTKALKEETKGEFGGVGMRLLSPRYGALIVVTPMPGTPAYKAGIEPQDRIITIDGKPVSEMNSDEAVDALRGKVGSKVKVEIERTQAGGAVVKKQFTLKRTKIVPEVVFSKMLNKDIGYISASDFSGHTIDEMQKAITKLQKEGMKALVLDLRFNPGGLLDGAVDMTKLFIGDNKLIVYTKGRKQEFFKEYKSGKEAKYADLPLVVLVNEGSASGSEIVAGAMQDYKRAILIGARTFGKGSVQQVVPLTDGSALRLTVAKYYTPLGRMIHKNFKAKNPQETGGIVPDIVVPFDLRTSRLAVQKQISMIYSPSKKTAESEIKDNVQDIVLDRAVEILSARDALSSWQINGLPQQTAKDGKDIPAGKAAAAKKDNKAKDEKNKAAEKADKK